MEAMRDVFFNTLFPHAKADSSIMVLTSDFSAPSFDRYRTELPGQFINTGISEQNTILTASGLAMSGMKVFVASIAPFITMRCFEQIRLFPADMNLDVTIVGVGAGFSYAEAGATHHSVEDIGLMRMLPHMCVYSPSSNSQIRALVERILGGSGPSYMRLDRRSLPELYPDNQEFGISLQLHSQARRVNFLATGFMTHKAAELSAELSGDGIETGVIDALRLPLDEKEFVDIFSGTERIISLEEHITVGGLGQAALEILNRLGFPLRIHSFSLDVQQGLCHSYGPREVLMARHGLEFASVKAMILNLKEELA